MRFTFTESARKDVRGLPNKEAARLRKKLVYWQSAKDPLAFAKSIPEHEEATHRFRFGPYRLLVKVSGKEMGILRVRDRKDVYKK